MTYTRTCPPLACGYEQVGVKEVADAVDGSVTTLFEYFPSKEALVFDLDEDVESALVTAVRDRPPGQSVPAALREHIRHRAVVTAPQEIEAFAYLIERTPALRAYANRMCCSMSTRDAGDRHRVRAANDVLCSALARFALDAIPLSRRYPDPPQRLDQIVDLLERGWDGATGTSGP
jgi:AcrR family transcriptional regulator